MNESLIGRAKAGDPVAIVEVVRRFQPPDDEKPMGYQAIDLHEPKRAIYPSVPRRLSEVDGALCDLFARLAAGNAPWPLLIHGAAGVGKSLAALSFCDLVRGSYYATLESMCGDIMAGAATPWRQTGTMLVLDELGERSKIGDLHYTALKNALDYREWNHRRVGIYVSNLTPAALANLFDDRIVSRLTSGSVYKMDGADRRQRKDRQ